MSDKPTLHGIAHRLVTQGLLDESIVLSAIEQAQQKSQPLMVYLAQNNILTAKSIAAVTAAHFNLSVTDLRHHDLQTLSLDLIDENLIRKHWILPLYKQNQQLHIALIDPTQLQELNAFKFHTGLNLQPVLVEYDQLIKGIETVISRKKYAAIKDFKDNSDAEDTLIISFVQQLLTDAIHQSASDIHLEPYENYYRIRLRIDGILHEITRPSYALANRITARLKVMAKLDISEKRIPQDGRFAFASDNQLSRDCRLSTCPTLFGEKIVIRILDAGQSTFTIDDLGLEPQQKNYFLQAIKRPQGMILVTGPTGSGKTISLYTALSLLNTLDKNISTVEDPVEINLTGINQVNINPKAGLTFATALRAFLRQDPDIIMVGEMRDFETAEIAIKAAQTGHLVLSTLHTNSATDTLTRLLNMGIASFNIASSVTLIIAQRLARRLCQHCKRPKKISTEILLQQGFKETELADWQLFAAGECKNCTKGYKGRIGIYEILPISEPIAQSILTNANALSLHELAINAGMQTLWQSALTKVKQGITSLEEISRVINY